MSKFRMPMALALAALLSLPALAQSTDAEVRKVDLAAGKITLKHGGVKSLDMPPMTMVFRVGNAKLLDGVAAGDRVKVDIAKVGGQYTVTALTKAN
ncbi:MAG: copper-binding protein [Rubrivivax sp.]|nr:copper-binding protein [Rubrivivax sp.]MDH5339812.1 copper-binding protein [Rubrivivax sp.]